LAWRPRYLGTLRLWIISRPWALLLTTAYAINTLFAFYL
jgi:hypothetical protein